MPRVGDEGVRGLPACPALPLLASARARLGRGGQVVAVPGDPQMAANRACRLACQDQPPGCQFQKSCARMSEADCTRIPYRLGQPRTVRKRITLRTLRYRIFSVIPAAWRDMIITGTTYRPWW